MPNNDKEFQVNSATLNPTQQAYFAELNKLINLLGVSAETFDNTVKLMFFSQGRRVASCAAVHVVQTANQNKIDSTSDGYTGIVKFINDRRQGNNQRFIDKAGVIAPDVKGRPNNSNIKSDTALRKQMAIDVACKVYDTIKSTLGTRDSLIPFFDSAAWRIDERDFHLEINRELRKVWDKDGLKTSPNILQKFASGDLDFKNLAQRPSVIRHDGLTIQMVPIMTHFTKAVKDSADALYSNLSYFRRPKRALLDQQLAKLDEIATRVDITAPSAVIVEKPVKKAVTKPQATTQTQKASAPDLPQRYPHSLHDWPNGGASLYQREIKPVCEAMDCRFPLQRKLGDALFTGKVLQVLQSHIRGQVGQRNALLNPEKAGTDKSALKEISEAKDIIKELFALQPDTVPAAAWSSYQELKSAILQSPVLLATLTGKVQQIDDAEDHIEAGLGNDYIRVLIDQFFPDLKNAYTSINIEEDISRETETAEELTPDTSPATNAKPKAGTYQRFITPVINCLIPSIPALGELSAALSTNSIHAICEAEDRQDHQAMIRNIHEAIANGDIDRLTNALKAAFSLNAADGDITALTQVRDALLQHPFALALAALSSGTPAEQAQQIMGQISDVMVQTNAADRRTLGELYHEILMPNSALHSRTQEKGKTASTQTPVPINQLCAQVDQYIRQHLPGISDGQRYQFHSVLNLDHPSHPITLCFYDMQGTRVATYELQTHEADILQAIAVKETLQNHILSTPGIVEFRKPYREGFFNPGWEDVLPGTNVYIDKDNGLYYLKFRYADQAGQHQEMSFSLGISQEDTNLPEAQRRTNIVLGYLAGQRAFNHPVTKGEAQDHLRGQVASLVGNQSWTGTERMSYQHLPERHRLLLLAMPNTAVRICKLERKGDPNLAWRVQLDILVNGKKIDGVNPSTRVSSRTAAQARTREIINSLQEWMTLMAGNGAEWNTIEQNGRVRLADDTIRGADGRLRIGQRDLQFIFDHIPHYKDDLTVTCTGSVPDEQKAGYTRYTVGVVSGLQHGVREMRMEKLQGANGPTTQLNRHFRLPSHRLHELPSFLNAVRTRFNAYVRCEYGTRSDPMYDELGQAHEKTSTRYSPFTAPKLLTEAILDTIENNTNRYTGRPVVTPGDFSWVEYLPPAQSQFHAGGGGNGANGRRHHHEEAPNMGLNEDVISRQTKVGGTAESYRAI